MIEAPNLNDVAEFVDRTRVVRDGVRSYHLVARRVIQAWPDPSNASQRIVETAIYEVWKTGDRMRTDFRKVASEPPTEDVGLRTVVCRGCIRKGYAAHAGISPDGSYFMAVKFYPLDAQYDREDRFRIDWKSIGLLNAPLGNYASEPSDATLVMLRKLPDTRVESRTLGKVGVNQLIGTTSSGKTTLRYAVQPALGGNPVEIEFVNAAENYVAKTTIEYSRAAGTDLWFPTTTRYNRSAGGKMILDETLTFETVEINQPIPERVFDLAGFGLDKDTPIEFPEIKKDGDQPLWDGEKVDPKRTARQMVEEAYYGKLDATPPVPDTPEPGRRLPYYAGAGLLTVVGGGLLYLAARRRRAAAA